MFQFVQIQRRLLSVPCVRLPSGHLSPTYVFDCTGGADADRTRSLQLSALRVMPSAEMRDAKVDGFMPSNSAAPLGPETFPFVCFKASMMASRSRRFSSSRVRSAALAVDFAGPLRFSSAREAGRS